MHTFRFLALLPLTFLLLALQADALPVPPRLPNLPLYEDGLGVGWENWSWNSSVTLCVAQPTHSGSCAVGVDAAAWGGFSLYHPPFDGTPYQRLTFYIHGGSTGNQQLRLFVHDGGGAELPPVELDNPVYIEGGAVAAGAWRRVSVPLADLGAAGRSLTRISIQGENDQPLFYLDTMVLEGEAAPPGPGFTLRVDAGAVSGTIPREMFGSNAAMWASDLHANTEITSKIGAAGITVVRFPGGSTADTYHWQDHANDWTTNSAEFRQFLEQVGAEGMITTNFGTGTAQEAAAWVRYMNVEHNWDVRYWEVGNEVYGDWETSWTHNPRDYILGDATHDGFNEFCAAMKAVDPTIQVGMVGTLTPEEYGGWGPTVLSLADDCADFYAIHRYPLAPGNRDYAALLADPPTAWPTIGTAVRGMIATNAPGRDIQIIANEYNSYWTEPESLAVETVNLLFLADTLGQLIVQGFAGANQWDIVNGTALNNSRYGLLQEGQGYYRQPSYYLFPLWARAGTQRLTLTSDRPASELTGYATRHPVTGDVTLLLINKGAARMGTIVLDNFQPAGTAEAFVAQGDSLSDGSVAWNGNESPPVALSSVPPLVSTIPGSTFDYTLPAYSVTALTLRAATNPGPSPTVTRTVTSGPSPTVTRTATSGPSATPSATKVPDLQHHLYLPIIVR